MKTNRWKLVAAIIGGAAAVAMMVVSGASLSAPAKDRMVSEPKMTTGQTSTEKKTPARAPETSVATPPFTFTTPEGFAVPH